MKKRGPQKKAALKQKKDPAAVKLGRAGAVARMIKTTPETRSAVAKNAAHTRWGNVESAREAAQELLDARNPEYPLYEESAAVARAAMADPSFGKKRSGIKSIIAKPKPKVKRPKEEGS